MQRERKNLKQLTLRVTRETAKKVNDFCRNNGLIRDVFIENAILKLLDLVRKKNVLKNIFRSLTK